MKRFTNLITYQLLILCLLLTFLFTFGCSKKKPSEIKIGAIAPLTGNAALYGTALKKGMDLALTEINSKGGIDGKKLNIIYEDNQADPKVAVSAINKLINVDKVSLILGCMFSNTTLAIAPIAQKFKVVLISPTASAEAVPNVGNYIFSIYPSDAYDGEFLADFAFRKLHVKDIAVINVQADAMIVCKDAFKDKLKKLGGEVLIEENYPPGMTDFRSILTKVKLRKPTLIFIAGYINELAKMLRQARELGIDTKFITISTAFDSKLFELAGNTAEGLLMSAPFYSSDSKLPEIVKFRESFSGKYGEIPNVWAAYGYELVKIQSYTYESSLRNRTELKDELLKLKDYSGVTGKTSFLKNGGVKKTLRVMIAQEERFIEFK